MGIAHQFSSVVVGGSHPTHDPYFADWIAPFEAVALLPNWRVSKLVGRESDRGFCQTNPIPADVRNG